MSKFVTSESSNILDVNVDLDVDTKRFFFVKSGLKVQSKNAKSAEFFHFFGFVHTGCGSGCGHGKIFCIISFQDPIK